MPDLDAELDALYAASLAEFTRLRNDLERRLRAGGQADLAAEVKSSRKPTLPAWVVNQLARKSADGMRELVQAGERVASAQTAGEPGASVAAAAATHRELIRRFVAGIDEIGGQALSDDVRQRVSSTLRNASLDPSAHDDLLRGRLAAEHEAAGFDALASLELPSTRPRPAKPKRDDGRKAERARLTTLRKDERNRLSALRSDLSTAKREAGRARKNAERADTRANELEQELERSESALKALTEKLETRTRRR